MASRTGRATNGPSPVASRCPAHDTASTTGIFAPGETASSQGKTPSKVTGNHPQRSDIQVPLHYLADDPLYHTTKPIQVTPPFRDFARKTNVRLESGPLETLNDVRGREKEFTLDKNGFSYVQAPTSFKDWSSQPAIGKEYLPELEQVLRREIDGCDEIIFYDARIRQEGDEGARVSGLSYNPFARQVHVDNTEKSVLEKIHNIVDLKYDYYMNGRVRLINIWRPIKHPVYDCGLAIADGGTLKEGDVMECERHKADTGQYWDTMGVIKYRPGFAWYYMSQQDEPDVLLFKNWDSATDVPARYCLHTAFDVPPAEVPAGAPTRESIEVRAMIFTLPKGLRRPSGTAVPQPLARELELSRLKLIDEEPSITDRIRADIDEGNEVKDAVLLIRKRRIRELKQACKDLTIQRDQHVHLIEDLQTQNREQSERIELLKRQKDALDEENGVLRGHMEMLESAVRQQPEGQSRLIVEACKREQALLKDLSSYRARDEASKGGRVDSITQSASEPKDQEIAALQDWIRGQEKELLRWKAEALGKGNQAVSTVWQGSVDEAVRKEREKDSLVIKSLVTQIDELKAAQVSSRRRRLSL